MRKLVWMGVLAALVTPAALATHTVTAYQSYGGQDYHWGAGGEFIAVPGGFDSMYRISIAAPAFETFCIELSEFFAPGYTYYVDFSRFAEVGGGGGPHDPLDYLTDWLYSTWVQGNLAGYDYDNNDVGRAFSAGELQHVLWYIEQEEAKTWVDGDNSLRDQFYQAALAANPQQYGFTYVMNLFYLDGNGVRHEAQSMLVTIPVPGAALLGVIGLSLVGWVKRRLA